MFASPVLSRKNLRVLLLGAPNCYPARVSDVAAACTGRKGSGRGNDVKDEQDTIKGQGSVPQQTEDKDKKRKVVKRTELEPLAHKGY
jgi:hypothetical protein